MRVLLVDDHVLVRAGIHALLNAMPGVEVIGEAGDGGVAIELAKARRPDVVLMDIAMKGINGLEATMRLKREMPQINVIILSMHASEEYVIRALRIGASGYLLKDAAAAELELALRIVERGEKYLSPPVSRLIESYERRTGSKTSPLDILTPRQRDVLKLIAEGVNTKEIAGRLKLSVKTVESHRAQAMERLGIRDVAGLVRYAIRIGLVSADNE